MINFKWEYFFLQFSLECSMMIILCIVQILSQPEIYSNTAGC